MAQTAAQEEKQAEALATATGNKECAPARLLSDASKTKAMAGAFSKLAFHAVAGLSSSALQRDSPNRLGIIPTAVSPQVSDSRFNGASSSGRMRTMNEKRSYAAPVVVALLLLLPCTYVGSYVALVDRDLWTLDLNSYEFPATYSVGGKYASWLFYPINQADRVLRPSYWSVDQLHIGIDYSVD